MAKHLNLFGLSARVILYFGRNPEEELTTLDIAQKFEANERAVPELLRAAVRDGALVKWSSGPGPGKVAIYKAGPVLLAMIGLTMEACAPAGNVQVSAGRL